MKETKTKPIEDKGCVACGDYAPEGTQICPNCKSKARKEDEEK